jgi:hypothetical protein
MSSGRLAVGFGMASVVLKSLPCGGKMSSHGAVQEGRYVNEYAKGMSMRIPS